MKITTSLFCPLLFITALAFTSCKRTVTRDDGDPDIVQDDSTEIDQPDKPDESKDPIPDTPPAVKLEVYTEFPEEIDGCACYFAKTLGELQKGQYIFMTNYEQRAFMKLDGEMRVFDLVSSTDLEERKLMEKWSNENYDMVIKTSQTGSVDETWQSIGTIDIKPTNKGATVISVVGECGC